VLAATFSQVFDVFLSHGGRGKAALGRIAERPKREAVGPRLDKWRLPLKRRLRSCRKSYRACGVTHAKYDLAEDEHRPHSYNTLRIYVEPSAIERAKFGD
jgi:hypothetical protein